MASFKYTICHPDKEDIAYPTIILNQQQALEIALNYSWLEALNTMEAMDKAMICFNPSLEFINQATNSKFTLTATLEDGNIMFSLWYMRKVEAGALLKIFGKKTTSKLSDKWGFSFNDGLKHLESFFNRKHSGSGRIV